SVFVVRHSFLVFGLKAHKRRACAPTSAVSCFQLTYSGEQLQGSVYGRAGLDKLKDLPPYKMNDENNHPAKENKSYKRIGIFHAIGKYGFKTLPPSAKKPANTCTGIPEDDNKEY